MPKVPTIMEGSPGLGTRAQTIYLVEAEDPMDSMMSFNMIEVGYFNSRAAAEACRDEYNSKLSPRLLKSSFAAKIREVSVK